MTTPTQQETGPLTRVSIPAGMVRRNRLDGAVSRGALAARRDMRAVHPYPPTRNPHRASNWAAAWDSGYDGYLTGEITVEEVPA